jgi:hypothetical protein
MPHLFFILERHSTLLIVDILYTYRAGPEHLVAWCGMKNGGPNDDKHNKIIYQL